MLFFGVITILDKIFNVSYSDHMAVAFISATKKSKRRCCNCDDGSKLEIRNTALIPMIQAPIVIGYLHLHPWLRRIFKVCTQITITSIFK